MEEKEAGILTLEAAAALLMLVLARKLYALKCDSESKCCGDKITTSAHSPGQKGTLVQLGDQILLEEGGVAVLDDTP